MKKVAILLSGCGVFDGAEIHESVLVLLALDRANAQPVFTAPDIPQEQVINHATRQPSKTETRNVLVESARIARGAIVPLSELRVADLDAIILPGGFGAANNLSSFGREAHEFRVHPQVASILEEFQRAKKPMGFVCIAPVIAAKVFGSAKPNLTIGTDSGTAAAIEKTGARHLACAVDDVLVDRRLKIATTPAYMLAKRITEAEAGINKLVSAVLEMA
jgi:enhancing lycopene biosynthesis protein 2